MTTTASMASDVSPAVVKKTEDYQGQVGQDQTEPTQTATAPLVTPGHDEPGADDPAITRMARALQCMRRKRTMSPPLPRKPRL